MSAFITPQALRSTQPVTQRSAALIEKTRNDVTRILKNQDDRLVVIIGPCSIHSVESALRYAEKLKTQIKKHEKSLCIIMRVYIEKARTSIGWKGFINDPDLNNTFNIEKGLFDARQLILAINECGVPTATEIINPFTIPYFSDLTSWSVIGARTTESQLHRELASDLPMPVGFKNNTNGDIQVAIDAIQTARQSHHYLSLDLSGKMSVVKSAGNPYAHVVLRGSATQTNYDTATIHHTVITLKQQHLIDRVLVDCSHGNSQRNHTQQLSVVHALSNRLKQGDQAIFGVMIESHLRDGKQAWTPNVAMHSDQSITDACIGWADTENALSELSLAVQIRRENMVNC